MAFGLFKKKNIEADSIYLGGTVFTNDPDNETATAVACKNGRIIAIGDDEGILEFEGENTLIVELEGDFLIPGLIDPSGHPALQVFNHCSIYLSKANSKEEILNSIIAYYENNKTTEAIFAYGYSKSLLEGTTMEDAAKLIDSYISDIPVVMLSSGGNGVWLNSKSIEKVKAEAEKDKLPSINVSYILYVLAPFNNEAIEKESILLGENYRSLGFTSVLSCGEPEYLEGIYQQCLVDMYQCGTHLQRFFGSYLVDSNISTPLLMQKLLQKKTTCMELDDNFNYNMVKLIIDSKAGNDSISRKNISDICLEAGDKGFDIHIDAMGEAELIDSFEAISKMRSAGYRRNTAVVAHNENIEEINKNLEDPIDFAEWQITETFLTTFDLPLTIENTNLINQNKFMPDFSKFKNIEDLITFYTLTAAEIIGFENHLGVIKNGFYADFAIYKSNPLLSLPKDFANIEISMTVINGMPTEIGDMSLDQEFFEELEDFDEDRAGLDGLRGLDNLGGIV